MSEHLDDDSIDLYVARRLPPAREDQLEGHLVGCAACAERVAEVQDLARAIEPERARAGAGRAWRFVAAGLVAACLVLGLEVVDLRREVGEGASARARPLRETARSTTAMVEYRLAAATRDGGPAPVHRAGAEILVLVADVRELAPAGQPLDVALRAAGGLERARFGALRSSASGSLRLPLSASQLPDGPYVLEIRWHGETLEIPFTVEP